MSVKDAARRVEILGAMDTEDLLVLAGMLLVIAVMVWAFSRPMLTGEDDRL